MNNPEGVPIDQERYRIRYLPVSEYDDMFQQLTVLRTMDYPIDMTIIRNDDEEMHSYYAPYPNDDTMTVEAPLYPQWAKFIIDSDFDRYIEVPDAPGDVLQSDNKKIQRLLEKHPIQLIHDVDNGDVSSLCYQYRLQLPENEDHPHRLAHERKDFPWLDVISRCIVAARLRRHKFIEESDTLHLQLSWSSPEADAFADQLIESGIPAINGEQIAGLVSDYYRLVEKHFPEFRAFKHKSQR